MFKTLTRLFRRRPTPVPVFQFQPIDNRHITIEQRKELREWLQNPSTKLALNLIESQCPSIMSAGIAGSVEERRYASEKRLVQLQGWNSFRNTLLGVGHTPDEIKRLIEETYPES